MLVHRPQCTADQGLLISLKDHMSLIKESTPSQENQVHVMMYAEHTLV